MSVKDDSNQDFWQKEFFFNFGRAQLQKQQVAPQLSPARWPESQPVDSAPNSTSTSYKFIL